MHKAFKYRIYPTEDQKAQLEQTFGACRFVYNWGLAERTKEYTLNKKSLGYGKLCSKLTKMKCEKETVWMNEVSSVCLQQSLRNLDKSFNNFFRKTARYPKFHSKRNKRGSATYSRAAFRIKNSDDDGSGTPLFFLAKNKELIRTKWSQELPSEPLSCNVSKTPSGKFFVSFLCEVEEPSAAKAKNEIGLDVGIKNFVTASDGSKYNLPKSTIKKHEERLKKAQKAHSRKKKGSKNKEKARVEVARRYEKISNIRRDFLHKLSTKLVHENQVIAMEDLSVKGMMENKDLNLAKSIADQSWSEFKRMVSYKCDWNERQFFLCDRFFPSSKTCSACGVVNQKLTLKERKWKCSCGTTHDRDVNASINILAAGHVVSDCGADGRPKSSYAGNGRSALKQ